MVILVLLSHRILKAHQIMIRILHLTDFHLNPKNLRDWKNHVKEKMLPKMNLLDPEGRGVKDPKTVVPYEIACTPRPAL